MRQRQEKQRWVQVARLSRPDGLNVDPVQRRFDMAHEVVKAFAKVRRVTRIEDDGYGGLRVMARRA